MFHDFFENPVRIGIIAAILVLVAWLVTRGSTQRFVRLLPVAIAVLAVGLIIVERSVVTVPEQISDVLHTIAHDIESNDLDRIIRHASRTVPELRRDASRYIPRYTFHRATVKRNLQVRQESDDRAVATFNAVFLVSETRGDIKKILSPWFFIVDFVREDGTWKVTGYERRDPREGI